MQKGSRPRTAPFRPLSRNIESHPNPVRIRLRFNLAPVLPDALRLPSAVARPRGRGLHGRTAVRPDIPASCRGPPRFFRRASPTTSAVRAVLQFRSAAYGDSGASSPSLLRAPFRRPDHSGPSRCDRPAFWLQPRFTGASVRRIASERRVRLASGSVPLNPLQGIVLRIDVDEVCRNMIRIPTLLQSSTVCFPQSSQNAMWKLAYLNLLRFSVFCEHNGEVVSWHFNNSDAGESIILR